MFPFFYCPHTAIRIYLKKYISFGINPEKSLVAGVNITTMRTVDCNHCGKNALPLNDTIKVDSAVYCAECFGKNFTDESQLEERKVEKEFDPTVCTTCGNDFGDAELRRIANHPTCASCEDAISKRSFPAWVKGFFIGVLILVVFSIAWNMRFYIGYINYKRSQSAMQEGNITKAFESAEIAARNVPEVGDLQMTLWLYQGIDLMQNEQAGKAIELFNACKSKAAPEMQKSIDQLIMQARSIMAFDNKDYDQFMREAKTLYDQYPQDPSALAGMASAYACLYAAGGGDSMKALAVEYLDMTRAYPDSTGEMDKFFNRIEHRLYSKEIISPKAFDERYPGGWTKAQE